MRERIAGTGSREKQRNMGIGGKIASYRAASSDSNRIGLASGAVATFTRLTKGDA